MMKLIPDHPSFFDYFFFLSFLFFVVIILMNLLIGLAVSDIALIKDQAEIMAYKSQIDLICTTEAILLDDPYNFLSNCKTFYWIHRMSRCSCWVKLRHYCYKTMLPFITFFNDKSVSDAGNRILLLHNKNKEKKKQSSPMNITA